MPSGDRTSPLARLASGKTGHVITVGACVIMANVAFAWLAAGLNLPLLVPRMAFCYLTLLVFLFSIPSVRDFFITMSGFHRMVAATLFGSVAVGHLVGHNIYFPFSSWELYATVRTNDPVVYDEFMGTTRSGKSVRLLVEQLFPSVVWFVIPRETQARQHLARVLAERYNSLHADPVEKVDLVRASIKMHPQPGEIQPQQETIVCCFQAK